MATQASQISRFRPMNVENRQNVRQYVQMTRASLRPHGEPAIELVLLDLSTFGCRLEGEHEAVAGDRVWLRLRGGMAVGATVMWRNDETVGCRFDAPIDRALMRSLVLGVA